MVGGKRFMVERITFRGMNSPCHIKTKLESFKTTPKTKKDSAKHDKLHLIEKHEKSQTRPCRHRSEILLCGRRWACIVQCPLEFFYVHLGAETKHAPSTFQTLLVIPQKLDMTNCAMGPMEEVCHIALSW